MSNICEILRQLRQKAGLTQEQVSNYLSVDRSTYSYYETGKAWRIQ